MTTGEENLPTFTAVRVRKGQGEVIGKYPFLVFVDEFFLNRKRALFLTKLEICPTYIQFAGANGLTQITHGAGVKGFIVRPFSYQILNNIITGFKKTLEEFTFFQAESTVNTKLVYFFEFFF